MTQTWHEHASALASGIGNVERVPDATDFASPRSKTLRAYLMALSALSGILGVYFFLPDVPLQAAVAWLLVAMAFAGGLLSTWSPCGYSSVCLLRPNGKYSARSVFAWLPTLGAHAIGYVAGALILGGALGFIGSVLGLQHYLAYSLPVFALGLVLYGAHQFGFIKVPYPQRRCQVPHDARQRFPKWVIGLIYGFSLGLNYLTYVQTPLLYAVTGAALFSGSVAFAVGIFLVFNLGRFLPLVLNALPMSDISITGWLARHQENAALTDAALLVGSGFAVLAMVLA
jgi:cytochrome c biogenesis protein CcdA